MLQRQTNNSIHTLPGMHDAFWQYISESQPVSDLQPERLLQSIVVLQDTIFMISLNVILQCF